MLARDEEPQPTTQESMFNYVRLSDGGPRRHEGPRSEIEIIAELGQRVLGDKLAGRLAGMEHTGRIREAIGRIVPGFEQIGRNRSHRPGVFNCRPQFSRAAVCDGRWQGAAVCA